MVTEEARVPERGLETGVKSVLESEATTVPSSVEVTGAKLAQESEGSSASRLA